MNCEWIKERTNGLWLPMLDLNKLSRQMQQASFDLVSHQRQLRERMQLALLSWQEALSHEDELIEKLLDSRAYLPWTVARPLEPMADSFPLPALPVEHIVLASDGSQIAPSRHEISPCYLINISRICYRYGTGERAIQESEPYLYYREQELYTRIKHQHLSVSEQMIGIERSLMEFRELAALARSVAPTHVPVVALLDGGLYSLLPELINLPEHLQENARTRLLDALRSLQAARVPVCGYISLSRRSDCVQLLRLERCPFEQARCDKHCPPAPPGEQAIDPPCSGLMPLADRDLWQTLLRPGERSPLFSSTAHWPDGFQGQELCFMYLHTGYEVARLEFPRWVADRRDWLEWLQTLCWLQVEKGRGYPIALAEAHNQAVIKGPDRAQFYAMLSHRLASNGAGVALSFKELKKRRGLV